MQQVAPTIREVNNLRERQMKQSAIPAAADSNPAGLKTTCTMYITPILYDFVDCLVAFVLLGSLPRSEVGR